jgi:hypothetical protein
MRFEDVYRKYEHLTVELIESEEISPLEVAGAMMGQAMKLYKMSLSSEDFDALMTIITHASGLDEDRFSFDFDSDINETKH